MMNWTDEARNELERFLIAERAWLASDSDSGEVDVEEVVEDLLMVLMRRPFARTSRAKLGKILLPASIGTLVYALSYPWIPDEVQGVLLATTGTLLLAPLWLGRSYSAPLHGLLLLAQPLIPVFQYQLGFPLRAHCEHSARSWPPASCSSVNST
jgi:hypothetical protein